jgi:folate-binding protein YgfZ
MNTTYKSVNLTLVSFLLIISFISAFTPQSSSFNKNSVQQTSTVCFSAFDYEYIPPNPDADPNQDNYGILASSYPPGTPAGMRGEAVRSALLSDRCIGWDLSSEESMSMGGVLKIQGKGMRDFLNNKLTQSFDAKSSYQEACMLDAKGRVEDRLRICTVDDETAYVMASPGHTSQALLERWNRFIFPMDQIELTNMEDSFIMTLCSVQREHVEKTLLEQMLPKTKSFAFPSRPDKCVQWDFDDTTSILVLPSTGLPPVAGVGYTLVFHGNGAKSIGSQQWQRLISDANPQGPIDVGALEYETLRIEAGQPAYNNEISKAVKASPLELHWDDIINMDKGCYLGQEGIASIVKNRRGPPRTLYSVVFDNSANIYESQSRGDKSNFENLTKPPQPGQALYALGSNEELLVGTLTSVAEAGGTGDPTIVGLALLRRADSIMKKMNKMDLEIFREPQDFVDVTESSGMIEPPPLDPLDGLEVIVEGTFTVGTIKMVPSRRLPRGRNMFDANAEVKDFEYERILGTSAAKLTDNEGDEGDLSQIQAEAEDAAAEAEAAAGEARRKAEKMEMLKKKAEEAMAKRKQKKEQEK